MHFSYTEDEQSELVGILSFLVVIVVLLLLATIVSTILAVVFYRRRKKRKTNYHISYHRNIRDSKRSNDYVHINDHHVSIAVEDILKKAVADDERGSTVHSESDNSISMTAETYSPPAIDQSFPNANLEIPSGASSVNSCGFSDSFKASTTGKIRDIPHQQKREILAESQGVSSFDQAEGANNNDDILEEESKEYHSKIDESAVSTKAEIHPSSVKSTDSSPAGLRKRRMSWTTRLSDSFRLSSTAGTPSEETQTLLSDEIPEESHTTEAPTDVHVTDGKSEWESRKCDSKGERRDFMTTEIHLPLTVPPPQSSSYKKLSLSRPVSASRYLRQSSTTSTDSTSEAEKGIPKSPLEVVIKTGSKAGDSSKSETD